MINLLPPQQKEELKKEEKRKIILILGIILFLSLLFFSLLLFFIKIYTSNKLESLKIVLEVEEKKFKMSEMEESQRKITALNKKIAELDNFYQKQINLTEVLNKISQILPPGIYLTSLNWQKETSQIELSGFAPLREDLLLLKTNIEKEEDFTDINFPLSVWVKPKEIDFQVIFKLKSP